MRSLLAIRLAWELALWRYIGAEQPEQAERLNRLWHAELVELALARGIAAARELIHAHIQLSYDVAKSACSE